MEYCDSLSFLFRVRNSYQEYIEEIKGAKKGFSTWRQILFSMELISRKGVLSKTSTFLHQPPLSCPVDFLHY